MTNQKQLGNTRWKIADELRGAMNADDFRDYMLSFLFLRYLSDNHEAAAKKELGADYPQLPITQPDKEDRPTPLAIWYGQNSADDVRAFEAQMQRKVHYVIIPAYRHGDRPARQLVLFNRHSGVHFVGAEKMQKGERCAVHQRR
jgi:type I restriction enzyme M protein